MSSLEVLMPIITSEGEQAVITAWMVDDGATVRAGQLIAEAQAEKVAVDIEATGAGVVTRLVAINEAVAQGAPICRIAPEAAPVEPPEAATQASASTAPPSTPSGDQPRLVVPSSPLARRLAKELGVELATVTGTGPGGRITEADVRAAAGPATPADEPIDPPRADEAAGEAMPMTRLRSVIAKRMRAAHAETAPVTLTTTAVITSTSQLTARVVRAVAWALTDHPALNGRRGDGDTFVPAATTGISLAIQTDEGLVAPVLRNPGSQSLDALTEAIGTLAERARSRRLTLDDYEGGTFSVTNLGQWGIDAFSPIINLPEVAILGVGRARTVVTHTPERGMFPQTELALSLTFDHAFVDGAPAAEFLGRVVELLA